MNILNYLLSIPFSFIFLLATLFKILKTTPKIGIPINIPIIPNKLPPTIIANITHRADNPIELPTTLEYIKFPSNC